jgi:hypothetical protein
MAIKGYGNLLIIDKNGKLWVDRFSKIEFAEDLQTREVFGYPFDNDDGLLQAVDAFATRQTFNCQVETGSFDKYAIARTFDQQLVKTANLVLPHAESYVVPNNGEITIAELVANQSAGVFLQSDTNPLQLTQTTTTATATTFVVSAGKVTLDTSHAGKTAIVNRFKTYTDIETLGVSNTQIGEVAFTGRTIGPRFSLGPQFYIPKMAKFSGTNFGGETSQVTYRALLKPPFAKPIVFAFDVPVAA